MAKRRKAPNRVWVLEFVDMEGTWKREETYDKNRCIWRKCRPMSLQWVIWHWKIAVRKWWWEPEDWRMRNIDTDEVIPCVLFVPDGLHL